jgi:hypothetical protein
MVCHGREMLLITGAEIVQDQHLVAAGEKVFAQV